MKRTVKTTTSAEAVSSATNPRKRPRVAEARLSELLTAAADVFIEQGFDKASLREIAERAGASKATLYGRFPNKESLFTAVLKHRMDLITDEMTMETIDLSEPLDVCLTRFGIGLLEIALTDTQIAIIRTISNVSGRIPALGEQFYRMGTLLSLKTLSGYLRAKQEQGELSSDEQAELMAQQFITLSIDSLLYRKLLGIAGRQTRKDRTAQVAHAVKMFLRCYAPKTPDRANVGSKL
ncbi:TetR/AcrR family transcriptional regulator [Acidipila sp. EB88]|uniref:TetR/AcrR family transcriptional regulator n=1 Tax=Acidipila sp. EB88 TaxID=2305226 RepID=UPI000F5D855A|nr:TetR/AcrR family transcriptional regulator [Acidipila sp. EB88]RRA47683.1 TetR/AcrR family transcriptional regulator [Acidipila sp. EB88]